MSHRLICLAAAAVVSILPLAAAAATLSFTTSATEFDSDTSAVLSLSRFDPTLGTLEGVTIEVNAVHDTRFSAGEACPPTGTTCNFVLNVQTTVTAATLTGDLASASNSGTDSCSTTDLLGCVQRPPTGFQVVLNSLNNVAAGDIALFTGSGTFDIRLLAVAEATGAGSLGGFWNSAEATVTYTYATDPSVVPLPAGMPLLIGGVAALAIVRRRRRA